METTQIAEGLAPEVHGARPDRRDNSEAFKKRLLAWFCNRLKVPELKLAALDVPASNGYANETFFVDLERNGAVERYVVRRAPMRDPIFLGFDASIQHLTMRAVAEASLVPVPKVLWVEDDATVLGAPFFVMERVDGRVPPDNPPYVARGSGWVADAATGQRASLWWSGLRALLGIHRTDWRKGGLAWMERPTRSGRQIEWELEAYRSLYEKGCTGQYRALLDEAYAYLSDRLPQEPEVSLCWGDARLGNMMFRDWECAAVLDWEMASLGAPEKDLAYWLYLDRYYHEGIGLSRMSGWPTHEETMAEYSRWLGRPLADMPYYMVYAGYRSLVIYARFVALGLMPASPPDVQPGARLLRRVLDEAVK